MEQYTIHTSKLFDPKAKQVLKDASVTVDKRSGLIVKVFNRNDQVVPFSESFKDGDIDLRGKFVMPGFVDAHTHVFLHSYE